MGVHCDSLSTWLRGVRRSGLTADNVLRDAQVKSGAAQAERSLKERLREGEERWEAEKHALVSASLLRNQSRGPVVLPTRFTNSTSQTRACSARTVCTRTNMPA